MSKIFKFIHLTKFKLIIFKHLWLRLVGTTVSEVLSQLCNFLIRLCNKISQNHIRIHTNYDVITWFLSFRRYQSRIAAWLLSVLASLRLSLWTRSSLILPSESWHWKIPRVHSLLTVYGLIHDDSSLFLASLLIRTRLPAVISWTSMRFLSCLSFILLAHSIQFLGLASRFSFSCFNCSSLFLIWI